jgi:hypothetical protein
MRINSATFDPKKSGSFKGERENERRTLNIQHRTKKNFAPEFIPILDRHRDAFM